MGNNFLKLNAILSHIIAEKVIDFLIENFKPVDMENFALSLIISVHINSLERCILHTVSDRDREEAKRFIDRLLVHLENDKDMGKFSDKLFH